MATLLSYGFTATAKQTISAQTSKSLPPPKHASPTSPLPLIPNNASLKTSMSSKENRGSPIFGYTALKHAINRKANNSKTPTVNTPEPSSTRSPLEIHFVPPPLFSATLFPPKNAIPLGLQDHRGKGLHDSERIKQVLRAKQLGGIVVPPKHDSSDESSLPSSAESTILTPVELYNKSRSRGPTLSLKTTAALAEPDFGLTPIEMDLGALAVIAAMPDSNASSIKGSVRNSVVGVKLPGGSVVAVITPEQSAWQRFVYLPGPIRLESPCTPNPSSALTPLDLLQEPVNPLLGYNDRLATDDAIINEVVGFFESFGEEFKVHNTGLDAYWIDSPVDGKVLSGLQIASQETMLPEVVPRLPSHHQYLPSESFDRFAERTFDYPSRNSVEWQRRSSVVSSQRSETSKTLPYTPNQFSAYSPPLPTSQYSPGLPSSPLPVMPRTPPQGSPRKTKVVKGRGTPMGNTPRMSFRRLISSASAIV